MGSVSQNSIAVDGGKDIAKIHHQDEAHRELDAGALFVLKSKGSWLHCGYHLTNSIVCPPLLSLPYAITFLGWEMGILCLAIAALVTFYSYNSISLVLEHHAHLGRRHLRFRDMAHDILGVDQSIFGVIFIMVVAKWIDVVAWRARGQTLRSKIKIKIKGPNWGRYYVGPIQFMVCYGAVVGGVLLGGQCMKAIYLLSHPGGTMKLYEFVIIFGCLILILAQIPSFHSLRHINLIALALCLTYSACATAGSIYVGNSSKGPNKDYSIAGDSESRVFGIFNAIGIIATTFGNGIIPEIQATIAPPVKGKMFKGLCFCYAVLGVTFLSVAISGYWAFGNQSEGLILGNFLDDGKPLVPKWFIFTTNFLVILQQSAIAAVYLQPTNEVLEKTFGDPLSKEFSLRNVIPRIISRSLSVIIATFIAAMLPFFGDINSVLGAFGFIPLDFILPVVFFNLTFKPSKSSPIFWLNVIIAVVFSAMGVIAAIAAARQIGLDAKNYQLFANI